MHDETKKLIAEAGATPEQQREISKLLDMFREEELDPKLAACLIDTPYGGKALHHPLYVQAIYSPQLNAMINAAFAKKQEMLEQAVAFGRWDSAIFLHERPYRLGAFTRYATRMACPEYWELLAGVLIDTENQWQNRALIREMLTNPPELAWLDKRREYMASPEENAELDAMPDSIQVFRGYQQSADSKREGAMGFSWTTDGEKAIWFANRWIQKGTEAILAIGTISKANVIAYFTQRNESEILCLPEHVEVQEEKLVTKGKYYKQGVKP